MKKLTIGFSPCPNDTFIFDALVNGKISNTAYGFEPVLEDVETLNQWALQGKLTVTKLSYAVLPQVIGTYKLLNSGSALGRGVGPLLITGGKHANDVKEELPVAIPGQHTTAHLLFSLAYPAAKNKIFMRYDQIEDFVLQGKGLGVIIHENRFTYEAKGLKKITDLGNFWEQQTGLPIPLGGIVIDKNLPVQVQHDVNLLISNSVEYAFAHSTELNDYIRCHAQEMSEEVMRRHIELYVNQYSLNLGQQGKEAVLKLLEVYAGQHKLSINTADLFV